MPHDATTTSLHLERGMFVLTCGCGWRSSPVRAVGIGPAWDGHVAVTNGRWPVAPTWREERVLSTV